MWASKILFFIVKKKHFVCDCYRYLNVMIFHKTSDYISSFQGHFQYAVSDLLNYNRYTPFELIQFFVFFYLACLVPSR